MVMRTEIEDAVVEALQPLLLPTLGGEEGGYLRAVVPYQGTLSPGSVAEIAAHVRGQLPAVLVAAGDSTFSETAVTMTRRTSQLVLDVELLALGSNARSREAAARGDAATPSVGVYQVLQDVNARLAGAELGIDGVGALTPVREQSLAVEGPTALWRSTFQVAVELEQYQAPQEGAYEEFRVAEYPDVPAEDPVVQVLEEVEA